MKLFFRSLPRLIKSANIDMKRHLSMTVSAILSVAIALLLSMAMFMVTINVSKMTQNIEGQLELQVSLSPGLSDDKKESLEKEIQSVSGVGSVTFSSKNQELDKLISENGEMFARYKDANPLYDIYLVEVNPLNTLEDVSDTISTMDGVVEVNYGGGAITRIIDVFSSARLGGLLITVGLMFLGVFLIRNTITMTISTREDEISIMRTVGAYNFYIQMPFILEGISIGFYGALIPTVLVSSVYSWLYYESGGKLVSDIFSMVPPWPMLGYVVAGVFAVGIILGMSGSWLAVRKQIRKVR
ncbi:permease-like cell division protein FtsX [Ileibacterium valens]|uniref:Cell division protein FtsX n=1 Tax=Ileibacterium valens TaxID=1862668 RepID=A0A1U7NE60_9FIRM|nr:permease-like cell division protein FtsX [Ileibacterium valens]OLU36593.1 hypothetical protein BO224_12040 [Erysipelotrichaceae bacterium NYU-BL-E8]OLU37798.1 hypothetical protein BO222_09625 [Ileibacterium valens]OLU41845.1 hypothetical protein BM735_03365 [Erysipelotrichaceae bacterium NYU-BL-F16]